MFIYYNIGFDFFFINLINNTKKLGILFFLELFFFQDATTFEPTHKEGSSWHQKHGLDFDNFINALHISVCVCVCVCVLFLLTI